MYHQCNLMLEDHHKLVVRQERARGVRGDDDRFRRSLHAAEELQQLDARHEPRAELEVTGEPEELVLMQPPLRERPSRRSIAIPREQASQRTAMALEHGRHAADGVLGRLHLLVMTNRDLGTSPHSSGF